MRPRSGHPRPVGLSGQPGTHSGDDQPAPAIVPPAPGQQAADPAREPRLADKGDASGPAQPEPPDGPLIEFPPAEAEPAEAKAVEEQAVLVHLDAAALPTEAEDEYALSTLEYALIGAVARDGTGEFDGDWFRGPEVVLYLYGPDAEALFRTIEPVLRASPYCWGARVEIRPGGPDVAAREVLIDG